MQSIEKGIPYSYFGSHCPEKKVSWPTQMTTLCLGYSSSQIAFALPGNSQKKKGLSRISGGYGLV